MWRDADWHPWLPRAADDTKQPLAGERLVEHLLTAIPQRDEKVLADLSGSVSAAMPIVAGEFRTVVDASLVGEGVPRRVDVAASLDTLAEAPATDLIRVHDMLVEGGIYVATYPAAPGSGEPRRMRTGDALAGPVHEVELQYVLRRSGLRGLRIRRFTETGSGRDLLLCMAVRRADN